MRIPAISFDPPVGAPVGVSPLHALAAANGTAVSPDGRRGAPGYRRAAKRAEAEESKTEAAAARPDNAPPAAPLPTCYPPLETQRAVLDRPAREADDLLPVVPVQRAEAPTDTSTHTPVPGSALDETLRRIIGAV